MVPRRCQHLVRVRLREGEVGRRREHVARLRELEGGLRGERQGRGPRREEILRHHVRGHLVRRRVGQDGGSVRGPLGRLEVATDIIIVISTRGGGCDVSRGSEQRRPWPGRSIVAMVVHIGWNFAFN